MYVVMFDLFPSPPPHLNNIHKYIGVANNIEVILLCILAMDTNLPLYHIIPPQPLVDCHLHSLFLFTLFFLHTELDCDYDQSHTPSSNSNTTPTNQYIHPMVAAIPPFLNPSPSTLLPETKILLLFSILINRRDGRVRRRPLTMTTMRRIGW